MAKKKPAADPKPQNRSPAFIVYARVDPRIGEALAAFLAAADTPPTITTCVEVAIREFLVKRGFWPPPQQPREG